MEANKLFGETLNVMIDYKHLVLRAEYLDTMKELFMKNTEKGCMILRTVSIPL